MPPESAEIEGYLLSRESVGGVGVEVGVVSSAAKTGTPITPIIVITIDKQNSR